jgi:hypothetical protein
MISFGVPIERDSFATSHGKSACDRVVGTLKRLATKASLQRPHNDQIMTPNQLYEWAQSSIHDLDFDFMTENDYKEEEGLLLSVNLQQLQLYVELSSSMHLCRLRKAYLTQKCVLLLLTIQRTM